MTTPHLLIASPAPRRARRGLLSLAAATLVVIALIGVAHLPFARPALGRMARLLPRRSCPLGYDRPTTAAGRHQARARFAATHRGVRTANAPEALGFTMGRTTRDQIDAAMAARGAKCRPVTATLGELLCQTEGEPRPGQGANGDDGLPRSLWFTFGGDRRLVSLVALSRTDRSDGASAAFSRAVNAIDRTAGPPTGRSGAATASDLASGPLRQAAAEFRYADYYASVRATNMGPSFLLTEEYRWLVD